MKRKIFIQRMTLGTGAIFIPSLSLLQGCEYKPKVRSSLSNADVSFLDQIGDTFIPESKDSPGAKASKIGAYMLLMYKECMSEKDKKILLDGINTLDALSSQSFSKSFQALDTPRRIALLERAQTEAMEHHLQLEGQEEVPPHYFDILKALSLNGYFTSEIGMTKARTYLPIPGKFVSCIPYKTGDKPWAS